MTRFTIARRMASLFDSLPNHLLLAVLEILDPLSLYAVGQDDAGIAALQELAMEDNLWIQLEERIPACRRSHASNEPSRHCIRYENARDHAQFVETSMLEQFTFTFEEMPNAAELVVDDTDNAPIPPRLEELGGTLVWKDREDECGKLTLNQDVFYGPIEFSRFELFLRIGRLVERENSGSILTVWEGFVPCSFDYQVSSDSTFIYLNLSTASTDILQNWPDLETFVKFGVPIDIRSVIFTVVALNLDDDFDPSFVSSHFLGRKKRRNRRREDVNQPVHFEFPPLRHCFGSLRNIEDDPCDDVDRKATLSIVVEDDENDGHLASLALEESQSTREANCA